MDKDLKKKALRMIPYGLYVLTAKSGDRYAASTINWVTQTSFEPPLVVAGVKVGSGTHDIVKESGHFALNMLGKEHKSAAFGFFKPVQPEGDSLGGLTFSAGETGSPIFAELPGYIECKVVEIVEKGDHSIFVGEVIAAGFKGDVGKRPDDQILIMQQLGENTFYGG